MYVCMHGFDYHVVDKAPYPNHVSFIQETCSYQVHYVPMAQRSPLNPKIKLADQIINFGFHV